MPGLGRTARTDLIANALRACRPHIVSAAAFSALINLLYLAPTLYMLQVYDRAIPTGGIGTLALLSLVLVFALATLSGLDWMRSRLLVRMSARLDAELSGAVLSSALSDPRLPPALRIQAARDLDTFRQALTGGPLLALLDAPWAPIYLIAAFLLHPLLGATCLVAGILLTGLAWLNERATGSSLKAAGEVAAATYASQDYASSAADTVRALGMGPALVAKHRFERSSMIALQTRASFASGGYLNLIKFARMIFQSLALGLGAYLAISHQISGGAVIAAGILLTRTLAPFEQIAGGWKNIVTVRIAHARLQELLATGNTAERTALPTPRGELRFEQISVVAPSAAQALLRGINLRIAPGEIVSVVGPSGAGKSTLLRAAVGAMPLARGVVRIDGAALEDWASERLARHVGYLPQDFVLFGGTVKENISRFRGYLEEPAHEIDELAVKAAKAAGAHQMILDLPQGYDTRLGFNGNSLSAGQRQRIALARALFGDPCLLVLDEPNANLDTEGEMVLCNALANARQQGVAVIMAAHHGPVLGLSDRVVVLKGGEIQAVGPRDSILRPTPAIEAVPAAQLRKSA